MQCDSQVPLHPLHHHEAQTSKSCHCVHHSHHRQSVRITHRPSRNRPFWFSVRLCGRFSTHGRIVYLPNQLHRDPLAFNSFHHPSCSLLLRSNFASPLQFVIARITHCGTSFSRLAPKVNLVRQYLQNPPDRVENATPPISWATQVAPCQRSPTCWKMKIFDRVCKYD